MRRARLSSIELAILKAIANGMSSKEIAPSVKRSVAAVEANIRALFAKFDAQSRAHLVALAFCLSVIAVEDIDSARPSHIQSESSIHSAFQNGDGVATIRASRKFDKL